MHASDLVLLHASDLVLLHASNLVLLHASDLVLLHASDLVLLHASDLVLLRASDLVLCYCSLQTELAQIANDYEQIRKQDNLKRHRLFYATSFLAQVMGLQI